MPWLQEGGQVRLVGSASMDALKSTLYNCVLACLMRRSQYHDPFLESDISILGVWVSQSINLKV